ncbi:MAG TPA: hypothetical protein VL326_33785 [Kofleriaceae bacterium]|jgi:hypothetical protein|nr:hypothetical protein [Kofleriaceae bacterium]
MSRALLVALLAVGCGRQLNPEYCAGHPEDTDCQIKGLAMVDAPLGCPAMACTDQKRPVCEESTHNCVECIPPGQPGATTCPTPSDICGEDRLCHACLVDTHCTLSMVCLANGTCADKNKVLYAAPPPPNGPGMGDTCSIETPCTFNTAVSKMDATHDIVKMTTTKGTDYSEPGVTLEQPGTIIGTGATFTPTGNGAAISMSGLKGAVEIVGLTIQSSRAEGILCAETPIQIRRVTINNSATFGLKTSKCDATVERSRFQHNAGGAMELLEGTFEIRNNVVAPANGTNGVDNGGNLHLDKAKGRVVFNTVVDNLGKNNKPAGIGCTGSAMLYVGQNIATANGDNKPISNLTGDCPHTNNFTDSLTKAGFRGTNDYHLTLQSVTNDPYLRDDPTAETAPFYACRLPGMGQMGPYIDDFDGYLRPYNLFCDRGAYEYHPPTP